jgi:hypothetical protein
MDKQSLMKLLSWLAVFNSISFAVIFMASDRCGRSDGCLAYSALLLVALISAALLLVSSSATWLVVVRENSRPSKLFISCNLILLVASTSVVTMAITYVVGD